VEIDEGSYFQVNVTGNVHYPFLNLAFPPEIDTECSDRDPVEMEKSDVPHFLNAFVSLDLSSSFSDSLAFSNFIRANNGSATSEGEVFVVNNLRVGVGERTGDEIAFGVQQWQLVPRGPINIRWTWVRPTLEWRYVRTLPVQPVGIRGPWVLQCDYSNWILAPGFVPYCPKWIWVEDPWKTGPKGLAFGQPQATHEWSKANVVFAWKPLVYVNNGNYKVLDDDAEEDAFVASYSDPFSIEVFFAEQFVPEASSGGGYCNNCGTASAYVLSTEKMIDCGVDITHLAHELGHVLALRHPSLGPPPAGRTAGSEGSLMCGSGYERDNPRRNTQQNSDGVQNPLLYWQLVLAFGPAPALECDGDAEDGYAGDCGSCATWVVDGCV